MITRAKISGLRSNSFVVVKQFTMFSQFKSCFIVFFLVIGNCIRGAALIQGRRALIFCPRCGAYLRAALNQGRCLFE